MTEPTGESKKIKVDLSSFTADEVQHHAVVDYRPLPDDDEDTSYDRFLAQFEDLSSRWTLLYGDETFYIISKAAVFQRYMYTCGGPIRYDRTRSPLFLALRCLVVSHDIMEIRLQTEPRAQIRSHIHGREAGIERHGGVVPQIGMWLGDNVASDFSESRKPSSDTLCYLLQEIFASAQKSLLTGNPRLWPLVLYTLMMLIVARYQLKRGEGFTDTFLGPHCAVHEALERLADLFLYCCGDMHPLTDAFDPEWFDLCVGGEQMLINDYEEFHELCGTRGCISLRLMDPS